MEFNEKQQFIEEIKGISEEMNKSLIFNDIIRAITELMINLDKFVTGDKPNLRTMSLLKPATIAMYKTIINSTPEEVLNKTYANAKGIKAVKPDNIKDILQTMSDIETNGIGYSCSSKLEVIDVSTFEHVHNELSNKFNANGDRLLNIPNFLDDEENEQTEEEMESGDDIIDGDILEDEEIGDDDLADILEDGDIISDEELSDEEELGDPEILDMEETKEESDNEVTDEELIKRLKAVWGEQLRSVVNSILTSYDKLYASGYALQVPRGLLTNAGIIKSTGDGTRKVNGDLVNSLKVYDCVVQVLGEKFSNYSMVGEEPTISAIESNPKIYTDWHLALAFGHFKFGNGLKKYLLDKYPNEYTEGTVVAKKWEHVREWAKHKLEEYFYKAYIEKGVTDNPEDVRQNMVIVENVNNVMSASLKNVIVVLEDQKAVNFKIRVCLDRAIDTTAIKNTLEDALNVGQSRLINVDLPEAYKEGVVAFNIIYNKKSYFSQALYAYQVVDILKEKNILPSWRNVILGKKTNGEIFTKNFKDNNNPFYAMYGSMGSGKGVMTLNLLASALADDCIVMYMDSKPDSSTGLAEIVWKQGKDGLIYNGVDLGVTLEELVPGCPRDMNVLSAMSEIPDGVFVDEGQKAKFLKVNTYLRGLELWRDICVERAQVAIHGGKLDKWLVVVFDECQMFAGIEREVVDVIERAANEIKKAKRKDNAYASDSAYLFCDRWISWRKILESKLTEMPTAAGRKADMTAFFIWQTAAFPKDSVNGSLLASFLQHFNSKLTKIVGRGAAQAYAAKEFGSSDLKSQKNGVTWYDEKFTGEVGGYWAIGTDVNSNDAMTVFRPFNVYASVGGNSRDLLIKNAQAQGLEESDLIGVSLLEDGSVNPLIGFEDYTNKLLEGTGKDIASQISSGLTEVNNILANGGFGVNAHQYIYSIYNPESDKHIIENMKVAMGRDASVPDLGSEIGAQEDADEAIKDFRKLGIERESDRDFVEFKLKGLIKVKQLIKFDINQNQASEYFQKFVYKHAVRNNFKYDDEKSLTSAAIVFSNVVYICQNFDVMDIDDILNIYTVKMDRGGVDRTNAILATGIIKDLMNGDLAFDTPPTKERMVEYLRSTMKEDNKSQFNFEHEEMSGQASGDYDSNIDIESIFNNKKFTAYEDDIPVSSDAEMSFENGDVSNIRFSSDNGNIIFDTSRINSNNTRYVNDDSLNIMAPDKINMSSDNTRNLLSTLFGTRNELKRRNKLILKEIAKAVGGKHMVIRLAFIGNQVLIGNKTFDVSSMTNNEYGIAIEDIINIHEVIREFPNIKKLVVDTNIMQNIIYEYGDEVTGIAELFNSTANLREFGIYTYNSNKPIIFKRENFANTTNAMKAILEEESAKMKIDQLATAKATRVRPTQINRCWNGTKKYGGQAWNKALDSMFNAKTVGGRFKGFAGNSLLALGTIAFGGIASIGNQGVIGIKSLFSRDK